MDGEEKGETGGLRGGEKVELGRPKAESMEREVDIWRVEGVVFKRARRR